MSRLYRRENYGTGQGAPKMINTKMTYMSFRKFRELILHSLSSEDYNLSKVFFKNI